MTLIMSPYPYDARMQLHQHWMEDAMGHREFLTNAAFATAILVVTAPRTNSYNLIANILDFVIF